MSESRFTSADLVAKIRAEYEKTAAKETKEEKSYIYSPEEMKEMLMIYFDPDRHCSSLFRGFVNNNPQELKEFALTLPNGALILALMCLSQDEPHALALLQCLSVESNAEAQYVLAELYADEIDPKFTFVLNINEIKPNKDEAFRLLQLSAKNDCPYAQYRLGSGDFTQIDEFTAFAYLQRAEEQDTSHCALRIVGWEGKYTIKQRAAAKLAQKTFENKKLLDKKDEAQIIAWLSTSVSKDKICRGLEESSDSSMMLGDIYSKNTEYAEWSTPENLSLAAYWYGSADTEIGYIKAGKIYEASGNHGAAALMYRMSASEGGSNNETLLINLYQHHKITGTTDATADVIFHTCMALEKELPEDMKLQDRPIAELLDDFRKLSIENPGKFYELLDREKEVGIFIRHGGREAMPTVEDNFELIETLIGSEGCQALWSYIHQIKELLRVFDSSGFVVEDKELIAKEERKVEHTSKDTRASVSSPSISPIIFLYMENPTAWRGAVQYFYLTKREGLGDIHNVSLSLAQRYALFSQKQKEEAAATDQAKLESPAKIG